jgi:hypothetical protein
MTSGSSTGSPPNRNSLAGAGVATGPDSCTSRRTPCGAERQQVDGIAAIGSIRAADFRWRTYPQAEEGRFLMRDHNRLSAWALAITTFIVVVAGLFITYGIGALLIATGVVLPVVSYMVHRNMDADLLDDYSHHANRTD